MHVLAVAAMAELRLSQGRVDEAERLVAGFDGHPAAAGVIARIHLERGHAASAEALVRRWLASVPEGELQRLLLTELLGEAELAQQQPDAAVERARTLTDLGDGLGCELAVARGERLAGRALAAAGDSEAARSHLDVALAVFGRARDALRDGTDPVALARAIRGTVPEVAATEAGAGLEVLDRLGARRDADAAAALLRELGVRPSRRSRRGQTLTRREREVLALLGEGLSKPEIAERLVISRRTVEGHGANVLAKLGLRNRAEAAAEAIRRLDSDERA